MSSWIHDVVRYAKRVGRAMRGIDLLPAVQVRCRTLRLGNDRARWCISPDYLCRDSVVYSIGIGDDISFDLGLIRKYGLTVHAFDPTPRSRRWLDMQLLPPQFVYHDVGIAHFDGIAGFSMPDRPDFVSFSMVLDSKAPQVDIRVQRLATMAAGLGHGSIDLLKMDIEGAEYDVIDDIIASGIPIRQFLVEFHHRWPGVGIGKTREAIRKLNDGGFAIFDVSACGEEYSFIRRDWPS
jgi:FkbM family methyltransferase